MAEELVSVVPDDLLPSFEFQLNAPVMILTSARRIGRVIGRAQFMNADASYLVRHENAAGDLLETWFAEDALEIPSFTARED